MDFDILYQGMAIESFSERNVKAAIKYVKARYLNNGEGCSLVYFEDEKRVTVEVK